MCQCPYYEQKMSYGTEVIKCNNEECQYNGVEPPESDDCISKNELLDAIYNNIPSELTADGRRVVEISTLIDHIAEM